MKKTSRILGLFLGSVFMLAGCNFGGGAGASTSSDDPSLKDWREENTNCTFTASTYEGLNEVEDLVQYQKDVRTHHEDDNGVIISPYYELEINGQTVPVYATRTTNSIHSFAYLDVEKTDENFALNTVLKFREKSTVLDEVWFETGETTVDVLPESAGVKATIREEEVTCVIRDFGSFSFVFNKFHQEPLTLFVAEKEDKEELFGNYDVVYFEPGDYSTIEAREQFNFKGEDTVYYLKPGRYKVDCFVLPSNSILYLEQGAYVELIPWKSSWETGNKGLLVDNKENVKVAGRGLIDYSLCCGSVASEERHPGKSGLYMQYSDNVSFSGVTVINSPTWTLCMVDCEGVQIDNCMFYAYRVYADGIMLSDCKNAIVEDSFIRTGDDAFETKSTSASGLTDNVLFRNNAAWTDKAIAYGCIYESNHDTRNVRFENCSVGFALGTWSAHLGCCAVQMGNRLGATMENITFENIEVFASYNAGVCNVFTGGSGGQGIGWGHVNNIYFKDINIKYNYGAVLSLHTYDEDSLIEHLYLDNVVSEGVLITKENFMDKNYFRNEVIGGYDADTYLHFNTRS